MDSLMCRGRKRTGYVRNLRNIRTEESVEEPEKERMEKCFGKSGCFIQ